jgi:primosomal protein N' (replication factor Y)
MKSRVAGDFPAIQIIDMRAELLSGNRSVFSRALKQSLIKNKEEGRQSILFLNRRGHSTFISCRACGYALKCDNCDINYTYHQASEKIICHYCGKNLPNPEVCPVCGSKFIKYFGAGTQKVEEELSEIFGPENIFRMDRDATTRKNSHEKILSRFKKSPFGVLIGTQMIAKGLDFPNVSLVGIVSADVALNAGDFRAAENAFSLLTQVAGRAGRGESAGKVFIQTYNPSHYGIVYARENNYEQFYAHEIALRRQLNYPPFTNIFVILALCEDERRLIIILNNLARLAARFNRKKFFEILGPAPCYVSKVKSQYRWKLIVKGADEDLLKKYVFYCLDKFTKISDLKGVKIDATLNPVTVY